MSAGGRLRSGGLRIGLLTASASRLGGGVFEAVVAHAAMLRSLGHDPVVFALRDAQSAADCARFGDTPVRTFPVSGPRQIGYARGMAAGMAAAQLDLVHLHGIWMYPSAAGAQWARNSGRPYLISPHGMLDPWITGRGKWKKALARAGYERASWQAAAAFHALTPAEEADIRREAPGARVALIPNPAPQGVRPAPAAAPHIVYLGRLHPKKNLVALVEAWAMLEHAGKLPPDARLTVAGWGDPAYAAQLAALGSESRTIALPGQVFGPEKEALLASAKAVILPSLSEGLPMAVLEAWALARPTIMTADCNLPEGFAAGAALRCGHDRASIADAITTFFAIGPADYARMADAALSLARGPFAPTTVAERWQGLYASLAGRREAAA